MPLCRSALYKSVKFLRYCSAYVRQNESAVEANERCIPPNRWKAMVRFMFRAARVVSFISSASMITLHAGECSLLSNGTVFSTFNCWKDNEQLPSSPRHAHKKAWQKQGRIYIYSSFRISSQKPVMNAKVVKGGRRGKWKCNFLMELYRATSCRLPPFTQHIAFTDKS